VRVFTRGFVVLWVAMLVAMAGIGMVSPLLPVYVRDTLHGPAIGVALSFSGLALGQMTASPFVGRLGDTIGTKPFIVAGFFVYAVGAVGYVFAPTWHVVVFFRILCGFGAAGIFPMALAYVGRMAPSGREGSFMGAFGIAQMLGFGLGYSAAVCGTRWGLTQRSRRWRCCWAALAWRRCCCFRRSA
jgi:MFS family permease